MKNTRKLLSITGLKKYFDAGKTGFLGRKKLYLRANDGIDLDIYRGETLGLVGESGSGKSTFGRTLLQLYHQTGGRTVYYGRSLEQLSPRYVDEVLKNAKKYLNDPNSGGFQTAVALLGGFAALPDCREAAQLLRKYYAMAKNGNSKALNGVVLQLEDLRQQHAKDPEFQKYETLRDDGVELNRLTPRELRQLRRDIQIVFQDPYSSLNPRMTVGQILSEGPVTHGLFKPGEPALREYVLEIMEKCGLQSHMYGRYPHQFSGGQRQRISIARALAVQPKFVVCDECISALDVSVQSQIINLLQELKEKEKLTYLFISHDLSVVRYISDRIGVLYLGNLVELGSAEEVFSDPRHPYTVALLSAIPTTEPAELQRQRILLEGGIPSPVHPPKGCKFHTRCYMACEKCRQQEPPKVQISPGHWAVCHFPDRKLDEKGKYLFSAPGAPEAHHAQER